MTIEQTLQKLQKVVRLGQKPDDDRPRRVRRLFDDIEQDMISLTDSEEALRAQAVAELQEDLRLEHLDERSADRAVWRFLCDAYVDRKQDHVEPFVRANVRQPLETTCFFPLEHLTIKERVEIGGVILLPVDDPDVPAGRFVPFPPPCEGIVAVQVIGTSGKRMKERAERLARHALRVLRVGMDQDRQIHDRQLRFRLGSVYAFKDGGEGWGWPDDQALEVALDGQMRDLVLGQPIRGSGRCRRTAWRRRHSWRSTGSIAPDEQPIS